MRWRSFRGASPMLGGFTSLGRHGGRPLRVHEVVADHVHDDGMYILDAAHVGMGSLQVELRHGAEFAAVAAGERNGAQPMELAYSTAFRTLGELPETEIAITTSPSSAKFFNCSTKTLS